MIEMLEAQELEHSTGSEYTIIERVPATSEQMHDKINELVDAVNKLKTMAKNTNIVLESLAQENNIHEKQIDELQMKLEPHKCEPAENEKGSKVEQDPYAEQRKWIGTLCKFWDYEDEERWFSVLEHIDKNSPYPYCASGDWWYKHCEPVKPDDDIIYKDK